MSNQLDLLPPHDDVHVTYVPKFSKDECLLGYEHRIYQAGRGFGSYARDDSESNTHHSHILKFLDAIISGHNDTYPMSGAPLQNVITMINGWLANKKNKETNPLAWAFISENGQRISSDIRYYLMKDLEAKFLAKEEELRLMKLKLNLDKTEVNVARVLTAEERRRIWVEFGGVL